MKDAFDANIVVFSATDQDSFAQERTDLGHAQKTVERSFSLWRGPHDYGIGTQGSVSLNRPL